MRTLSFLKTILIYLIVLALCTIPQGSSPVYANPADDFLIMVKTDNPGDTDDDQFLIPTVGGGYNYKVDCNNDTWFEEFGVDGDYLCTYGSPGTYAIRIVDTSDDGTGFPRIYFNGGGDAQKLVNIVQWGSGKWTSMEHAFEGCSELEGSPSDDPDLSNVTNLRNMFYGAEKFNGDVRFWDTSNVTNMSGMFYWAESFNKDIGNWNTSNVIDMSFMFYGATSFNQDIGDWNTSNVEYMRYMFHGASAFDQDIGEWDTSKVREMYHMFYGASSFNQDIGEWSTGLVKDMSWMFRDAQEFNQDISGWDTGSVEDMEAMFYNAANFNCEIGTWNTGSVKNMQAMFQNATAFNGDISLWDTHNVTNMERMFRNAQVFNQNIGTWDTSKVSNMRGMFMNAAAFDQDLGGWQVGGVTDMTDMFAGIALSQHNYDSLLIGWDAQDLKPAVTFNGGSSTYCLGASARKHMMDTDFWSITDGGKDCFCTIFLPIMY